MVIPLQAYDAIARGRQRAGSGDPEPNARLGNPEHEPSC